MGPGGGEALARFEAAEAQRELEALCFGWGEAYEITAGPWAARRRDGLGGPIEAGGPDELRRKIEADYAMKPVPRDLPDAPS